MSSRTSNLAAFLALPALLLVSSGALASEGKHHDHHVAAFVGATTSGEETAFTAGLDYELRLSVFAHRLGLTVLADFAFFEEMTTVVAGGLVLHPIGGLKAVFAVGAEHEDEQTELLIRESLAYEIPVGFMSLAPTVSVDLVDGDVAFVYGLEIGAGF